jgi:hypothetical protein
MFGRQAKVSAGKVAWVDRLMPPAFYRRSKSHRYDNHFVAGQRK